MLRTFEQLQNAGKIRGRDLRSMIYLSMTFRRYKNEVSAVTPPNFVLALMAGLGRLLGYKLD